MKNLRYLLIRKPHKKSRLLNIENTVELKILLALIASLILHFPMVLQNTVIIEYYLKIVFLRQNKTQPRDV